MKALIQQYLLDQGINEPFSASFLRYTEKLTINEDDIYYLEFPRWRFNCPPPTFTSQQIKDSIKDEYITLHTEGIQNKYLNDEYSKQQKINELNSLIQLNDIKNFTY